MSQKVLDKITKSVDYDIRILVLDIALANTGWCIYEFSSKNFKFRIRNCDTIITDTSGDRPSRIRLILSKISELIIVNNINCVIVEEPPQTIFGKGKAAFFKGRAASVFSVVAACYSVIGFCYARGIFCREIHPKQWQEIPKGADSKAWSLQQAKKIFDYLKYNKKISKSEDNHLADAVCIGIRVIKNFTNKKWIIPSLIELSHE